jgi:hypothetical protein
MVQIAGVGAFSLGDFDAELQAALELQRQGQANARAILQNTTQMQIARDELAARLKAIGLEERRLEEVAIPGLNVARERVGILGERTDLLREELETKRPGIEAAGELTELQVEKGRREKQAEADLAATIQGLPSVPFTPGGTIDAALEEIAQDPSRSASLLTLIERFAPREFAERGLDIREFAAKGGLETARERIGVEKELGEKRLGIEEELTGLKGRETALREIVALKDLELRSQKQLVELGRMRQTIEREATLLPEQKALMRQQVDKMAADTKQTVETLPLLMEDLRERAGLRAAQKRKIEAEVGLPAELRGQVPEGSRARGLIDRTKDHLSSEEARELESVPGGMDELIRRMLTQQVGTTVGINIPTTVHQLKMVARDTRVARESRIQQGIEVNKVPERMVRRVERHIGQQKAAIPGAVTPPTEKKLSVDSAVANKQFQALHEAIEDTIQEFVATPFVADETDAQEFLARSGLRSIVEGALRDNFEISPEGALQIRTDIRQRAVGVLTGETEAVQRTITENEAEALMEVAQLLGMTEGAIRAVAGGL